MPLDGIIDGLREAVSRYPADSELAEYVRDASEALCKMDEALDGAFQEGKKAMYEEVVAVLEGGRSNER